MPAAARRTALPGITAALLCLPAPVICRGGEIHSFSLQPLTEAPPGRTLVLMNAALLPDAGHIVEDSPDLVTWHRVSPVLHSADGLLNWRHTQADISAEGRRRDVYQTAGSSWRTRRFYRVRQIPPAEPAPVITGMPVAPAGGLSRPEAGGPCIYKTSGGWTVRMSGTTLIITNPAGTGKYEIWGEGAVPPGGGGGTGHENLNGKHLKDLLGGSRTLLLPDGVIITVSNGTAPGRNVLERVSIYDGNQSHRLTSHPDGAGSPNTVEMSVFLHRAGEAEEPDGETGRLLDTPQGLFVENIYHQPKPSDGQPVTQEAQPLGFTGGPENPNQVNDYYDDPRLGHT